MTDHPNFKKKKNHTFSKRLRIGAFVVLTLTIIVGIYSLLVSRQPNNLAELAETPFTLNEASKDSKTEEKTAQIDASSTAPHKPSLNELEQNLLDEAVQFYKKSKENLDRMKIDGHNKIFDRVKIDNYKSQLGSLPQTNEVVEALLNLNELNNTYYQNGYRKDEYQLIIHQVEEGKYLHYISQKYGVSEDDIMKHNPYNIDDKGGMKRKPDGSLPALVIYKKY